MLEEEFHEKVYKLALNGGMSCPNRDGTLGTRGCIFCSAGGSGDFAANKDLSITQQIEEQMAVLTQKRPVRKYIAYFQAYTNTYAPVSYLESILQKLSHILTLLHCPLAHALTVWGADILSLLDTLNHIKPVWVELGLQTMHESTARLYPKRI